MLEVVDGEQLGQGVTRRIEDGRGQCGQRSALFHAQGTGQDRGQLGLVPHAAVQRDASRTAVLTLDAGQHGVQEAGESGTETAMHDQGHPTTRPPRAPAPDRAGQLGVSAGHEGRVRERVEGEEPLVHERQSSHHLLVGGERLHRPRGIDLLAATATDQLRTSTEAVPQHVPGASQLDHDRPGRAIDRRAPPLVESSAKISDPRPCREELRLHASGGDTLQQGERAVADLAGEARLGSRQSVLYRTRLETQRLRHATQRLGYETGRAIGGTLLTLLHLLVGGVGRECEHVGESCYTLPDQRS